MLCLRIGSEAYPSIYFARFFILYHKGCYQLFQFQIKNVTRTRDFVSSDNAEYFPIPRIFPKGTLGMYPTKSMHDNDNGAATPSIWMSVEGEDSTTLSFHGMDFEISLTATTHHFYWFMG